MSYGIKQRGDSRSFPEKHALHESAVEGAKGGLFLLGEEAGALWNDVSNDAAGFEFVAIELNTECLGVHIGDDDGPANVVGFARFRLGDDAPTQLVELVRKPFTDPAALQAAKTAFEGMGLKVAVCQDFPGRILNRLVRPYYNAALRRLDDGLASEADMDKTLCLGLGYPEGPISLLKRTGLHHHYEQTQALYEALGQEAYAPARRAQVAWARHKAGAK